MYAVLGGTSAQTLGLEETGVATYGEGETVVADGVGTVVTAGVAPGVAVVVALGVADTPVSARPGLGLASGLGEREVGDGVGEVTKGQRPQVAAQ